MVADGDRMEAPIEVKSQDRDRSRERVGLRVDGSRNRNRFYGCMYGGFVVRNGGKRPSVRASTTLPPSLPHITHTHFIILSPPHAHGVGRCTVEIIVDASP